jgi:group I intron endonuclease
MKIISAVYKIKNLINKKVYIGSSVDVKARLCKHRNTLLKNKHKNSHLQHSFNKYSAENFSFEVYDEIAIFFEKPTRKEKKALKENILFFEQLWMDNFESYNQEKGYNLSPTAGSQLGIKHSKEAKERMSAAKLGIKHSKEAKERMRLAQNRPEVKTKKSKSGKKAWNTEAKEKMSKILKESEKFQRIVHSEEYRQKLWGPRPNSRAGGWQKGLSADPNSPNYDKRLKYRKGRVPWNKGLTKKTDDRVAKYAKKLSKIKGKNDKT